MSDQEMKDIWMRGGEGERISFDLARLIDDLKGKMTKLDRTLFFRDSREIIAAILVIGIFGYKAITAPATITMVTSILFVLWAVYIIYRLLDVRKYKKMVDLNLPFKNQLGFQRRYLKQQAHLLDSALSWYVGPFAIIMTIRIIGDSYGSPNGVFALRVGIILTLIYLFSWWLYRLNKRAAKRAYDPLIENIDTVLLQLEEDENNDDSVAE